jgi:hypothetical protein
MKPRLPRELEKELPREVLHYMYSFVPHMPKKTSPSVSPQLEKDLRAIQSAELRGMKGTYLRELEDFILD